MRCYRKILHISYKDHVTNEEVRAKIQQAIGPHEDLLTIIKRCKVQWYGHVSRSSGLAKTILQGTVKGGRRQGGQRKRWEDNIREWTGLDFGKSQRAVENREKWRKLVAKSSVVPQRPSRSRYWWWWWWWWWWWMYAVLTECMTTFSGDSPFDRAALKTIDLYNRTKAKLQTKCACENSMHLIHTHCRGGSWWRERSESPGTPMPKNARFFLVKIENNVITVWLRYVADVIWICSYE